MKLTIHGTERIQDRTKMQVRDVIALISKGAFVKLGSEGERDYVLFYSSPDKDVKIAILDRDRKNLVSVWEKDFRLPSGVSKVTRERAHRARTAALFKTRVKEQKSERHFKVTLEVVVGQKTVFAYECGRVPSGAVGSLEKILPFIEPALKIVVPIIESRRDVDSAQVRYDFWCVNELSLNAMRIKTMHNKVKEKIRVV
jgi:hypothetical protein